MQETILKVEMRLLCYVCACAFWLNREAQMILSLVNRKKILDCVRAGIAEKLKLAFELFEFALLNMFA